MAEIVPFKAWRYNPEVVPDIRQQCSPLFDVANSTQLQKLYENPTNSIHLSVPKSQESAVQKLTEWKEKKVIVQDEEPGIYVYYQYFNLFEDARRYIRKGFISMIRATEEDIVLHEDTITHSVNDRIALLEKIKLNIAPTHGFYRDPDFELEEIMDMYMEHPLYEYSDNHGVIHKVAVVKDPEVMGLFQQKIRSQFVYLADGHHRLESSKAYRDQLKEEGKLTPDSIANYHLMYLTNLSSDDLRILPTHRIWQPETKKDNTQIREELQTWFEITDVSRSRQPLFDLIKGKRYTFGMVSQGRKWMLQLKPTLNPTDLVDIDLPLVLKNFEYTLLHVLIFDKILGIPYALQGESNEILYEKDYSKAVSIVNKGQAELSFITGEVSMEKMLEICESGYKMPQKSTYFYPKVVCGFIFSTIDDHET